MFSIIFNFGFLREQPFTLIKKKGGGIKKILISNMMKINIVVKQMTIKQHFVFIFPHTFQCYLKKNNLIGNLSKNVKIMFAYKPYPFSSLKVNGCSVRYNYN